MYWDPFDELERMHEEMDRLFGRAFGADRPLLEHREQKTGLTKVGRVPVCHIQETENNLVATVELPGVHKGDIDLMVDDNTITLKVESKQEKENKNQYRAYRQSYFRKMSLPKMIDSDKARAEYNNGVLRIEMPKRDEGVKSRKVDIQ